MKYPITRFKNLKVALKELEPFIRNGQHLQTGRPFNRLGGMLSREVLANWLLCAAANSETEAEQMTFTSDPVGGDGIIHDTKTDETWQTEHVLVPMARGEEAMNVEASILAAIEDKQKKGGAAYARGKTLVVFVNAGGGAWHPNKVAKQIPATLDFAAVWAVGLQGVEDGEYVYGVTNLHVEGGDAPTWTIRITKEFDDWKTRRIQ
jgi:hypothetical protein